MGNVTSAVGNVPNNVKYTWNKSGVNKAIKEDDEIDLEYYLTQLRKQCKSDNEYNKELMSGLHKANKTNSFKTCNKLYTILFDNDINQYKDSDSNSDSNDEEDEKYKFSKRDINNFNIDKYFIYQMKNDIKIASKKYIKHLYDYLEYNNAKTQL